MDTNPMLVVAPAVVAALATAAGVALKGSIDRRAEAREVQRQDQQRFFEALMLAAAEAFAMCDIMVRKVDSNPRLHFGSHEMYDESVRFHAAFATLHLLGNKQVVAAANELHDLFDHRNDDGRVGYPRLELALRTLRNAIRDNLGIDRALDGSAPVQPTNDHQRQTRSTEPRARTAPEYHLRSYPAA